MSDMMVRKQIYLHRQQNQLLKRLAKQRGVSEAEIVRQALEREEEVKSYPIRESADGWVGIQLFVKERKAAYGGQGNPVQWNRQELYEERESGSSKPETGK
jgi:hypothetical protein